MTDKIARLEEVLEAMLVDDEKITARAVIRRMSGVLKYPTDITRNEKRKALVADYAGRQDKIRSAVERSSKSSRVELERQISLKNSEIERLRGEKELLIASHRAMILSTAEMGGFGTWKRFFDKYQAAIDALDGMGALPRAEVVRHPLSEQP
ncbi:hypothetical protein HNQ36_000978 [Afipia massiliensis]|uniref:Uncharacterized protein n=1 Tax=Afipia massiliensis TaxID=211460 RepID=A0A840MX69_9BRAD|nr:hypothetical protein [Afipia massiliensis]MBB5051024.1 hypothetical protein [Afipia massiliensis]